MAGCVPVGAKMLDSYLSYHQEPIHVYCFDSDFSELKKHVPEFIDLLDSGRIILDFRACVEAIDSFSRGHEGTAKVWAQVIKNNPDTYLIQIDSDIIFKKETLSLIEKQNYPDLYGSRRCYKNNPADIPVADGIEDALSTYFIGLNTSILLNPVGHEKLTFENQWTILSQMIQGTYNPLKFSVFDFFDPVFFWMRYKGASVYYEDPNLIGGQNSQGNKNNSYISNLHMDMGSHLCHFGGAGSGYAACQDDSQMNKSYSDWAKFRWFLFEDLFYTFANKIAPEKTVIKEDGRWVSGPYNQEIFNQIKQDLVN